LNWINDKQAYYSTKTGYKTITTAGQQNDWLKLPDNAENVEFDATNNQVGYVIDNNLFLLIKLEKHIKLPKTENMKS
jgi:dipeptidyl-peptidase-4